jgi:tagaturonate epimerase
VLAQQSVRELDRTGRSAREVLDAATWGAFAEGWLDGYGADADHLKTPEDVDRFAALGYTMYTIDPSDHVPGGEPVARHAGTSVGTLRLSEDDALGASAKYGAAIEHVVAMYEHLRDRVDRFDLEVSVDETDTPTTPAEHAYVALELRRRGVEWVSLAPRFTGRFEKGVDYIGDVERFAAGFAVHAAIADRLGPYKLSLHSGSDKFALYPAITGGPVHVKTSGTSYLEALRVMADHDPPLFRRLYALARKRFADERASYAVTVDAGRLPAPEDATLDDPDVRRLLHVTFGSVLADGALAARIAELREEYAAALERHLARHLEPFA